MRALMEVERIEIGELAECVFILKPSATRTIKNLEARGIVIRTRSNTDQRRAFIGLTELGRKLFEELAPRSEAEYARITDLVGAAEMQELYELLDLITGRLNAPKSK